jgi:hypothetical protein
VDFLYGEKILCYSEKFSYRTAGAVFWILKHCAGVYIFSDAFFIVGLVKERIFKVGSETGSVTFY